jgi:acyl carrier protein
MRNSAESLPTALLRAKLTFSPRNTPKESAVESTKDQLKQVIIKSLRLTDQTAATLRDDQPLIGGDLEIDSIDTMQLILEIERHFGIKLVSGKFDPTVWKDVNTLTAVIEEKLKEPKPA